MPMRATKASHFPSPLADIPFRALSLSTARKPSMRVDVTDRIRCEFVEMRGFSPTVDQAARLDARQRWQAEADVERLLEVVAHARQEWTATG